jgi:subtilisin family serine protease
VLATLIGPLLVISAAPPVDREARHLAAEHVEQLKTETPVSGNVELADVDFNLLSATGTEEVIVQLRSPSVAMANCGSQAERMSHKIMLQGQQSNFMERTEASMTSVKQLAYVHTLLNAVFLEINAEEVSKLAADLDVVSIHRVRNYELHLSETVPYIGATTVQKNGFDGNGIKMAILDSGIDYTHAAMGGEGTVEAYNAAYEDFTSRDGLFPTAKVIEGYDFVGEFWPNGPLLQDDDPIDLGGHGTAVADIAAGLNGVAPGASLYAVKVCSAAGSECSGIALIQGMDYAVDPNGDGDTSDAVDVINMSLGTDYSQPFDDDLSKAVEAATVLGVLTVAAAGNAGDKPYIVSTPSSTLNALSVAQTQVPSATLSKLIVGDDNYAAVFQTWSKPLNGITVTGSIQYGDGTGGNLDGCDDFATGSLSGKFVVSVCEIMSVSYPGRGIVSIYPWRGIQTNKCS